jgi:hypothetical protein
MLIDCIEMNFVDKKKKKKKKRLISYRTCSIDEFEPIRIENMKSMNNDVHSLRDDEKKIDYHSIDTNKKHVEYCSC